MRIFRTTPVDLLAVMILGVVVSSLGLVQVRRSRAVARQVSCGDNMKQLGLAFHNYHSAYKQFPMGSGGTSSGSADEPTFGNASRLSALVGLTPFLEQQQLWETIANPHRFGAQTFPAMGPVPWYDSAIYLPWGQRPERFVCPSDSTAAKFTTAGSYVLNYGDAVQNVGARMLNAPAPYNGSVMEGRVTRRGTFMREQALKFRDILDGTSNTLLLSESRIGDSKVAKNITGLMGDPSRCLAAFNQDGPATEFWPEGRGACWADGSLLSSGFQTILPPNSPSCTSPKGELEGVMSASSFHAGGVHVLFGDGRVSFIRNTIDAGKGSNPSVGISDQEKLAPPGSKSPYGLWGALGTRASQEIVSDREEFQFPPVRDLTETELAAYAGRPLERWNSADGGSVMARRIGLSQEGMITLLAEDGKQRSVPLSQLASADAYRAVQDDLAEQQESRKLIIRDINAALRLLEQREFVSFMSEYVDPSIGFTDAGRLAATLPASRGMYIARLDQALAVLQSPQSSEVVRVEGNLCTIGYLNGRFRESPRGSRVGTPLVVMRYAGDRWVIRFE